MRQICLILAFVCTLSGTSSADTDKPPKRPPVPGTFDAQGRLRDPAVERALRLHIDTFASYYARTNDVGAGIALGMGTPGDTWTWALQFSEMRIGVGISYVIEPFSHLSLGLNLTRDLDENVWTPGAHLTVFKW